MILSLDFLESNKKLIISDMPDAFMSVIYNSLNNKNFQYEYFLHNKKTSGYKYFKKVYFISYC